MVRFSRALQSVRIKRNWKPYKYLSFEAATSAQIHGKRQPRNNLDSNPHYAPEGARKKQSTTAIPKLLELSYSLRPEDDDQILAAIQEDRQNAIHRELAE